MDTDMNSIKDVFKALKFSNKFVKTIDNKTLSWFTDGSCLNNGNKNSVGGFGAVCVSGNKSGRIIYGKVDDSQVKATNIRAEGMAILHVLKYSHKHINEDWNKLHIYSDSDFWIKMIYTYMPKWDYNTFQKKANPDITVEIWKLWNILYKEKNLEMTHVYSHNKDNSATSTDPYKQFCYHNNNIADALANIGAMLDNYKVNIKKDS